MSDFDSIITEAHDAGMEAVNNLNVKPMAVFGDGKFYHVADGVCGFAWVNVKPGTSRFAKWLVSTRRADRDSYAGGVTIWISDFNQSMQKKETYARAYAEVLLKHNIRAYAASRMD